MSGWPRGRSRDGGIDEIPLPDVPGRLWLCGHRVVGPDAEAALALVGADTIVCLCQRHELAERYPDYVAWLDSAGTGRARWFPIPDLGVRSLDDHRDLVEDAVQRLQDGARLIAHCAAGIGRSGTFATAVLLALGVELDQALDIVGRHRPTAGPEVGSQAELVTQLAELYRTRAP